MKRIPSFTLSVLLAFTMLPGGEAVGQAAEPKSSSEIRDKATRQLGNGNYKDAYQSFRQLCLDLDTEPRSVSSDLGSAVRCLQSLGRVGEIDELLESTIVKHDKNWRLLQAAAQQYQSNHHQGYIISGKFERGGHRGGGRVVNSLERDHVRALQLLNQAIPLANEDDHKREVSSFYIQLAHQLLYNRGYSESWRLQYLSNLDELPEYDEGYQSYRAWNGAPVDEEGIPVFHTAPESWRNAETDGQRWRWCLQQAVEYHPARTNEVRYMRAQILHQQFGVQTMQQFGWAGNYFGAGRSGNEGDESGTYDLHTLGEDETIAKLATGIKRIKLPDEHNHIKLFQQVAGKPAGGYGQDSLNTLGQVFLNRRQYPTSVKYYRQSIKEYGDSNWLRKQVKQIVGAWGAFEGTSTQPAGRGASVEYRFRNASEVSFTAHEINVERLLTDVKTYLKRDPGQVKWEKINIANIGWRLVQQDEPQYIGRQVANWSLDLEPRPDHFDRRITVDTPLQKAGAYLVTAKLKAGNECKAVLWVSDTAIVKKQLSKNAWYFVADAVSGEPIERANLEFFGWHHKHLKGNRYQVLTTNFADVTDREGQCRPDQRDLKSDHQWLVIARTKGGRFAYMGFQSIWYSDYYDYEYNQTKAFGITDRPVYRPEQTVNFKWWMRRAQYDQDSVSQFANQSFAVEIYNPKGERIHSQNYQADEYGGFDGLWEIPADATLGQYQLNTSSGSTTFRVEEYKKPEFEVTVEAPTEPVMLGEKITATINAKYYFGSPVVNATVKYKIMRTEYAQGWYPLMPWDWCYGPGYWWFCYDYPWYPGWNEWVGCLRPLPWWWWGGNQNPPELVAEQEVEIGPDGTIKVEIDTALAKELHGNKDHQYSITAEVRDESRRTIVGTGKVLVARKPFKVFTWLDRGYYRVGDTIKASFNGQTLDQKPVVGEGLLSLFKITYDNDNQPVETAVRRWEIGTNSRGLAEQQIRASAKGQYRLSYDLTDTNGHTIQGGYLFTIIGEGFDGKDYRFNNIELIPDKAAYAPGEKVRLQINTDRVGSTVLLFVRPANGIYLPPKTIRLDGKSITEEIGVIKKDMPNFFVEAVTVADGKVHSDTKEIVVPPEKRVLNVSVLPSEEAYKPGQRAKVKVQLTDHTGENFVGSTVITIYDKSVEYISGGTNVPDIKEFFWKWRRQHSPNQASSLARAFGNLTPKGAEAMQHLGVFGATVASEVGKLAKYKDGDKLSARIQTKTDDFAQGNAQLANQASPASKAPMRSAQGLAHGGQKGGGGPGGGGAAPDLVQPTVRSSFADTAFWKGAITTDKNGIAEVQLDMPENLTTWKIKVWGMGHGTKVGAGEAEVVTRKDLIIRLQAPRFFVQKDEVVLSANVHNYLATDKEVTVSLELPDGLLAAMEGVERTVKVKVPADGETRVDWRVKVVEEGQATVRMLALTNEESDAMEMKFPCYVHGMLKTETWAGTVRPEQESAKVTIKVPAERRPEQSLLEIRYSPTLAGAMVDALPYMADYPYGCTEQTLNRFLPTVVTQKVLLEMGLDLAAIKEKRTNLNAQEIGEDRERAAQWQRFGRNPVFDEAELDRMVRKGVERLTNMQLSDGGWGWFSGWGEQSWPHTTAVVVHGLQIAQHNDVPLVPDMLPRGVQWLKRYQDEETRKLRNAKERVSPYKNQAGDLDALIYMILVDAKIDNEEMRGYLYRDRTHLSVYSKAMFGLALHNVEDGEKLAMIMENIKQYLVQDEENETAYLKLPADSYWWYWYGSETEANAYYLKLLARTDPKGVTAPRLVKYLLNNRKHATYWRSTRDTAVCVEAFADYIRASDETSPDMVVEIWVDGKKRQEAEINGENLFSFDNKFLLAGEEVTDGEHEIEIRRRGTGPVYFNAYLTNFTLEDMITRAGLEVKVTRKFYKLNPVEAETNVAGARGQAAKQRVERYEREELDNLAMLKSGDLVEVELSIDSKNDYEYIIFEDMKAAGFETVDVRSGYTNNDMGAYAEFRDNRVSFFVRRLARGNHSLRYRLRAEIPGRFSALPAHAYAMYAPELKGNSDELKLRIED